MESAAIVTLLVTGSDPTSNTSWRVVNLSHVRSRSPWLQFPVLQADMDGDTIRQSYPTVSEILIPLIVSASGLREQLDPSPACPMCKVYCMHARTDCSSALR